MRKKIKKINKNKGAAMLVSVLFFLFISVSIVSGLVSPVVGEYKVANDLIRSRQSFHLSESTVEDSYYRLKNGKPIGSTNTITINDASATATITDSAYNEKTISSLGDVSSRQKKNDLILNAGTGISFSYGVQVGSGGLTMANGSIVNGSVYSNGPITGSGSITGSATSANSPALSADQTNDVIPPTHDLIFGNANATQDFAQSFELSTTGQINKIDLYIKKVSTPSSLTVRIVSNSSGAPSSSTLASGPLSSSLVSTSYGWVSVPLSSTPELTAGTKYWIVIDGTTSSSKYYIIGANDDGYSSGASKLGQYTGSWSNPNPSTLDGFFKVYTGGVTGLIDGITVGSGGVGNTYAHTVTDSSIAGTNYCQTGNGNNKICNTSLADPTQIAMPISDQNILDWKAEALAGGVYNGNYVASGSSSIGPTKITGNLTVTNGASLTLDGIVWVQGNIVISNNGQVNLSPSYGTSDGMIIADGTVTISNNATFSGSGTPGSYIMVLSTSTSGSAITLSNNGGAVVLYAANGTVNLSNNSGAKALNGKFINLSNNAEVIYDSGLVNSNFVNGPSGGWSIKSWKEMQ